VSSRILAWALLTLGPLTARGDDAATAPARTRRLVIEPAPPGRLPWISFDERSGLPQHTIVDMLEDRKGFVWAATQDGAARFDGRTWTTVNLPASMRTNYPRAMRLAKDDGLWIGTFDGGLAHLRDDTWTITDETSGLPSNRIRGLLETTDAGGGTALWIATEKGVARLQDGRVTAFGEGSGLPSLDAEGLGEIAGENGERLLIVGTAQGLARFDKDRFVPVPVPRQILGHRIVDVVESAGLYGGPALWITSYGGGMAVREAGAWTVLDTESGLPSNVEVITRSQARDGSPALWIGTEGGLLRFEKGRFTLYDERSGLPIRIIWKVLETTSAGGLKTLWLGTWGGGVVRLSENHWRSFDSTTGMPAGAITSVLASRRDGGQTIWAGTSDGGLARFENGRFRAVELPGPLRHTIVFSLLETEDADGRPSLWVGSFGGGLGRLKDGRWTVYDPRSLPNERVYAVRETKRDDGSAEIWIGTEGGLGRLADGKWTVFRKELPSEMVTQVLETRRRDGARTLWAGTSRGIARLEDGRWSVVGKDAGLLSANVVALEPVTDADGTQWVWAGTFSGGASRVRLEDPGDAGRRSRPRPARRCRATPSRASPRTAGGASTSARRAASRG
jgi:ligand-binding sensor domain-containing protein